MALFDDDRDADGDDSDDEGTAIVIDNGSYSIKAGRGGNDFPQTVFHSFVGRPMVKKCMLGYMYKDCYVGDQCNKKRGILTLKYPIEHGIVTNWDDMEKIWHYTFYDKLTIAPEEHAVLLTNSLQNPLSDREKSTQIMFETFNVPALHMSEPNLLSLYANGQTTGCVLSVGHGICATTCIFEGYAINKSCRHRIDFGGNDITLYLCKLLNNYNKTQKYNEKVISYDNKADDNNHIMNYSFSPLWNASNSSHFEIINEIKNKLAFVNDNIININSKSDLKINDVEYELPDGHYLNIGRERYECMEILFNPKIVGSQESSLQELIYKSITKCSIDIRRILYENVIIYGGSSMVNGIENRLKKEIYSLMVHKHNIQIHTIKPRLVQEEYTFNGFIRNIEDNYNLSYDYIPQAVLNLCSKYCYGSIKPIYNKDWLNSMNNNVSSSMEKIYSPWIGGSILTSLSVFQEMWITKDEYDEVGPVIIHRKCPY